MRRRGKERNEMGGGVKRGGGKGEEGGEEGVGR